MFSRKKRDNRGLIDERFLKDTFVGIESLSQKWTDRLFAKFRSFIEVVFREVKRFAIRNRIPRVAFGVVLLVSILVAMYFYCRIPESPDEPTKWMMRIGILTLYSTISISLMVFLLQRSSAKKHRREQEIREALQFIRDNYKEVRFIPLCAIAARVFPSAPHYRDIYDNFNNCSKEVQNEIFRQTINNRKDNKDYQIQLRLLLHELESLPMHYGKEFIQKYIKSLVTDMKSHGLDGYTDYHHFYKSFISLDEYVANGICVVKEQFGELNLPIMNTIKIPTRKKTMRTNLSLKGYILRHIELPNSINDFSHESIDCTKTPLRFAELYTQVVKKRQLQNEVTLKMDVVRSHFMRLFETYIASIYVSYKLYNHGVIHVLEDNDRYEDLAYETILRLCLCYGRKTKEIRKNEKSSGFGHLIDQVELMESLK